MKAMRSRCCGSIFAWILNTKPLNASLSGPTDPMSVSRGWGFGDISTKQSNNCLIPKPRKAEPKNTGVWSPAKYASRLKSLPAPAINSTSSSKVSSESPKCFCASSSSRRQTMSCCSASRRNGIKVSSFQGVNARENFALSPAAKSSARTVYQACVRYRR